MNTEKDFAELKTAVVDGEIVLNEGQQEAYDALVSLVHMKNVTYLFTGASGTGKSTVTALAVDKTASKCRVAILAPTKAAEDVLQIMIEDRKAYHRQRKDTKNLTSVESVTISTVHSILGLAMIEQEDCKLKLTAVADPTLHNFDIIFIDECSMLDGELLDMILKMRGPNTNIVFCGDKNQIPPVNAEIDATGVLDLDDAPEEVSPVFAMFDLCPQLVFNLTEPTRQKLGSPINLLGNYIIELNKISPPTPLSATLVRDKTRSLPDQNQTDIILLRQCETRNPHLQDHGEVCPWFLENIVKYVIKAVDLGYDTRAICYTNKAVQQINRWVHCIRFPGQFYAPGERVLMHLPHRQNMLFRTINEEGELVNTSAYKAQLFTVETCTPIGKGRLNLELLRLHLRTRHNELVITDVPINVQAFIELKKAALAVYHPLRKERDRLEAVMDNYAEGTKAYTEAAEKYRAVNIKTKAASVKAWAVTKEHCELRYAYAVTSHSSQGQTFDCAVVHLSDFTYYLKDGNSVMAGLTSNKMNKMLYVAVTRPREQLIISHNDKLLPYQPVPVAVPVPVPVAVSVAVPVPVPVAVSVAVSVAVPVTELPEDFFDEYYD